jgi:endoglucanase
MKKTLITLCLTLSSLLNAPAITYGVYDIAQTMTNKPLTYEEIFVDQTSAKGWVGSIKKSVYDFCMAAQRKGRIPVINIEPFSSGNTLDEILDGKSDNELAEIALQLSHYGGPAVICWGHEAENVGYPWGGKEPAKYIAAYRYVVDFLRKYDPEHKLSFLWSPIGNVRSVKYYPGDKFVDYVGCSVFDTQNQGFARTFAPMYAVLSRYGKPMIIPESGVQALPSQAAWVAGLKATAKQFPLLKAVIYFNAVDPYPWVNGQKPDWRIDPTLWPPASATGETRSPSYFLFRLF